MKNIISTSVFILWLIIGLSNAQDITNTLAPNGIFKIKDSSNNFLSLAQSTGNLTLYNNLEFSGSNSDGMILKNGTRFIHTFGTENLFIGLAAGNFSMGNDAMVNTAVGNSALSSITSGYFNSVFGLASMQSNTTGFNNSAFGVYALRSNTSGYYNAAFGSSSLYYNSNGSQNSAFGVASLYSNTTGGSNSAFGFLTLYYNSSGINNTSVGAYSLYNNNASENTALGNNTLYSNTIGWHNTAVGFDALKNNQVGWQNTAVGHHSLKNNTGNYNTAIGYNAGSTVTTGYNLTLVGIDANPSSPTASDQVTLGNGFVSSLRCNVQTITSLSDVRDKKNIKDLSLGLDFITKLKPRQFNWDRRDWYEGGVSDGSKMQETPTAGFIAQEFDEVQKTEHAEWLNLVLKDNPDKWEATYGNLLPVMVKAIQELKQQNDKLIDRIQILEQKLNEINSNQNVERFSTNN
jgi:hypothetical protein